MSNTCDHIYLVILPNLGTTTLKCRTAVGNMNLYFPICTLHQFDCVFGLIYRHKCRFMKRFTFTLKNLVMAQCKFLSKQIVEGDISCFEVCFRTYQR